MKNKRYNWLTIYATSLLLSACGGSSTGGSNTGETNTPSGGTSTNSGTPNANNVRLIKETAYRKSGSINHITNYEYDSKGYSLKTEKLDYKTNGDFDSKTIHTFQRNNSDNLIKEVVKLYSASNKHTQTVIYDFSYKNKNLDKVIFNFNYLGALNDTIHLVKLVINYSGYNGRRHALKDVTKHIYSDGNQYGTTTSKYTYVQKNPTRMTSTTETTQIGTGAITRSSFLQELSYINKKRPDFYSPRDKYSHSLMPDILSTATNIIDKKRYTTEYLFKFNQQGLIIWRSAKDADWYTTYEYETR